MPNVKEQEHRIAKFFNMLRRRPLGSRFYEKRYDEKDMSGSGKQHIQSVIDSGAKEAIDVGSGPGAILFSMIDQGLPIGIGVDLSSDMIHISEEQAQEKYGKDQRKVEFIQGSFLDLDLPDVGAVSLHKVLCCHPDRLGMGDKTVTLHPKTVAITVPRDGLLFRVMASIFGLFSRLFRMFRFYVHSQKSIDEQLLSANYEVASRSKQGFWVTTIYKLKEESPPEE